MWTIFSIDANVLWCVHSWLGCAFSWNVFDSNSDLQGVASLACRLGSRLTQRACTVKTKRSNCFNLKVSAWQYLSGLDFCLSSFTCVIHDPSLGKVAKGAELHRSKCLLLPWPQKATATDSVFSVYHVASHACCCNATGSSWWLSQRPICSHSSPTPCVSAIQHHKGLMSK